MAYFVQKALLAIEDLTPEEQAELQAIRDRKIKIVAEHRRKKSAANNHAMLPHKVDKERTATTQNMKVLWLISLFLTPKLSLIELDFP